MQIKNYSCYVISGSEQNELRNILKFEKLDKYFKEFMGSLTKVENLKNYYIIILLAIKIFFL